MNPLNIDVEKLDIKRLQDELHQLDPSAKKMTDEQLKSTLALLSKNGLIPKKALKIDDTTMEAVYAQAYNMYNQGKYKEASYIFRFLMLMDMTTPKYILGTAACLHRMKDFAGASHLYFLCGSVDTKNPMPFYHATDCFLQLNSIPRALVALQLCILAAGDQPQYKVIKERAELLRNSLSEQLKNAPPAAQEEQKAPVAKKDKK